VTRGRGCGEYVNARRHLETARAVLRALYGARPTNLTPLGMRSLTIRLALRVNCVLK